MGFIKKYNQEITLGLFCVGIVLYGLGLSGFGKSFSTQTFFHIGGLLFVIYNYRLFSKSVWRILAIPIVIGVFLTILSFFYLFDEIQKVTFFAVIKDIQSSVVRYGLLFLSTFFFVLYASKRLVLFLCFFIYFICMIDIVGIVYMWIVFEENVIFFFGAIFVYNIWLILPIAMNIAGIWWAKGRVKFVFFLGLTLSAYAMVIVAERSIMLATLIMLLAPFFVWHYKYKSQILLAVLFGGILLMVGFYHISKDLSGRYNFAHMIDNFTTIWNAKPIEMGQYDMICFGNGWFQCAPESLALGKNELTWEHSSLSRIAMGKSALLAVRDNFFKPHFTSLTTTGLYLHKYYEMHTRDNRVYCGEEQGWNGYSHIHSTWIGLLLAYGILGFSAICFFVFFLLYSSMRQFKSLDKMCRNTSLAMFLMVCGICMQSFFDNIYTVTMQPLWIFFGVLVGLGWRDENPTNNQ